MANADRLHKAANLLSVVMRELLDLLPDEDTEDPDDPLALAWRAVDAVQTDLLELAGDLDPVADSPYTDESPMERLRGRGEI